MKFHRALLCVLILTVLGCTAKVEPPPQGGTVRTFGPGRHIITEPLLLTSGQTLRGAGSGQTILVFPHGLRDMLPGGHRDEWGGGVITLSGQNTRLEGVTIEFPPHYFAHLSHQSPGYHGVYFNRCTHCAAHDVVVCNATIGFAVNWSRDIRVSNTAVYTTPPRGHFHYGVTASQNVTITHFQAHGFSYHGLTGNWGARDVVFSNGHMPAIRLEPDHNGPVTRNILYQNISGTIAGIQRFNRDRQAVDAQFINVGQDSP